MKAERLPSNTPDFAVVLRDWDVRVHRSIVTMEYSETAIAVRSFLGMYPALYERGVISLESQDLEHSTSAATHIKL